MKYMPEYYFEDVLEIGINELPINCIILIKDAPDSYRRIYKISSAGLDENSTVQDFIDDVDLWFEI